MNTHAFAILAAKRGWVLVCEGEGAFGHLTQTYVSMEGVVILVESGETAIILNIYNLNKTKEY